MLRSKLLLLVRVIVFFIPETSGFAIKRFLYRLCGVKIGKGVQICSSAKLYPYGDVVLGKDVWIGQEAVISANVGGRIVIEDYAKIGMRVVLVTGFHEITPIGDCIEGNGTAGWIRIGKGAAVSTMSIIPANINIGDMAHVAAGSVVTKDVPPYNRVAGVPAKVIRDLRIPRNE